MFLHVSVIHSVHGGRGVGIPACNGPTPPPRWKTTTLPPPDGEPPPSPDGEPPQDGEPPHPPGMENPPPNGHCVGGTHPTGMHSCWLIFFNTKNNKIYESFKEMEV